MTLQETWRSRFSVRPRTGRLWRRVNLAGDPSRRRFVATLALVVLAHGLLLVWFMAAAGRPYAPPAGQDGDAAVTLGLAATQPPQVRNHSKSRPSVPKAQARDRPPPPIGEGDAQPEAIPDPAGSQASADAAHFPVEIDRSFAEAAGAPGAPCQLADLLQQSLRGDLRVAAALTQLPRSDRSVANALILWDGAWVYPADMRDRPALDSLRAAIVDRLQFARSDCLARPNAGPVFLLIPRTQETVVLTVGSGEWRWSDLMR